jgi:hypothetical protein
MRYRVKALRAAGEVVVGLLGGLASLAPQHVSFVVFGGHKAAEDALVLGLINVLFEVVTRRHHDVLPRIITTIRGLGAHSNADSASLAAEVAALDANCVVGKVVHVVRNIAI